MNYPNWSCGSNQEHLDVGNEDDLRKVAFFFFSSRRRHTRFKCDWSSDVCSSDLLWRNIYANLLGASFLYSMSSYVATWALARNTYYSGSLYDLPLVVSMAWMTVPGLLALKIPQEQARPAGSLPRGVWTARLGMVAVFSLAVFAGLSVVDGSIPPRVRPFRLGLPRGAVIVMG